MKKELSIRHIVVATMDLRLLLFLIERGVLTKFLDNCVKGIRYRDTIEVITRKFNYTTLKKTESRYGRLFLLGTYSTRMALLG